MMLIILTGVLIIVILLFSSKTLSPIPYFPSQPVDIQKIIEALNLQSDQTIIDLGAGDGIVIFGAAQKASMLNLNTKFFAVEINPILILILHIRRLFHSNKKNIKIIHDDIFTMNFSHLKINNRQLTIYLYISPWYHEKTISNIKRQIPKFSIVSYMYPIKSLKIIERIIQGRNKILYYH